MKKIYLREVKMTYGSPPETKLEVFEGNIEEDKAYWKKYHNVKARYFELKELK